MDSMILRIALPLPLRRLFDYISPQPIDSKKLIRGLRVLVPFQSRMMVGILIDINPISPLPVEKLKSIIAVLDEAPYLSEDILKLSLWAADYYHYSLGEILLNALPLSLRQGKKLKENPVSLNLKTIDDIPPILNTAQQTAIDTILLNKQGFSPFLLEGVTGSGKTEVYLRIIENILLDKKQALVLVPEISLTPQTVARFEKRFATPIFTFHSGMTEKKRKLTWIAAQSGDAKIIIGTRSAIFLPFKQLGLMIVDEEHDASFKQQERFRYHARDVAVMRARLLQIPIIMGSATPSLESILNANRRRYQYLSLPLRAGKATLPTFTLIDMRRTQAEAGLSTTLLTHINEHLVADNQVILFLNRRGFAPVLYCINCTHMSTCKRCTARLIYHQPHYLKCHHCDYQCQLPTSCDVCGEKNLYPIGLGTQRLEEVLSQHFPNVPIIRIDSDTIRQRNSLQTIFKQIHAEKRAILLGTQILAKGHHFPNVTLVGMIDGDAGLFSADFRATENLGQLLLQVGGRAGREDKGGSVMIQTHHPQHELLQIVLQQSYQQFANFLLGDREKFDLPPYSYLAVLRAESKSEARAKSFLTYIKSHFYSNNISLLGPAPPILAKRKNLYCQQLLIKSAQRTLLQQYLAYLVKEIEKQSLKSTIKWSLDVDPITVL